MKPKPTNHNPLQTEKTWRKGGYVGLAEAIIYNADFDLRHHSTRKRNDGLRPGSEAVRTDAKTFFNSKWFDFLASSLGYDPQAFRYNLRKTGRL